MIIEHTCKYTVGSSLCNYPYSLPFTNLLLSSCSCSRLYLSWDWLGMQIHIINWMYLRDISPYHPISLFESPSTPAINVFSNSMDWYWSGVRFRICFGIAVGMNYAMIYCYRIQNTIIFEAYVSFSHEGDIHHPAYVSISHLADIHHPAVVDIRVNWYVCSKLGWNPISKRCT